MTMKKKSWQQRLTDESQYYEKEVRRLELIKILQDERIKNLENQVKMMDQMVESCHLVSNAAGEVAHSASNLIQRIREGRIA